MLGKKKRAIYVINIEQFGQNYRFQIGIQWDSVSVCVGTEDPAYLWLFENFRECAPMKLLTRKMNLLMKELFLFPFVIIIIIIIIIYFEEIIKELLKLFFIVVGFRNTTKHKPSLIVTESKVCHPIAFKIWLHACNGANNTILMYLSGARTWWDHIIISRRCQQLLYLKCIYIYYRL